MRPSDMPRLREVTTACSDPAPPGPAEVENARLQNLVDQARRVYLDVYEWADHDDAAALTMHILDRLDDGVRPNQCHN